MNKISTRLHKIIILDKLVPCDHIYYLSGCLVDTAFINVYEGQLELRSSR